MELGNGKVAVVTGGASGIGQALARAFVARGMHVVIADIENDALTAAAAELSSSATAGAEVFPVRTDVSKESDVQALAAAAIERFGAVHVVCNNAGVSGKGDPWAGPLATWEWVMGVNFWGVVHGVRAFLPHLVASGGGHIVNTASMAGLLAGLSPSYDASKHAVVAMTENLFHAMTIAAMPVGVSCLCPGWVRTSIMDCRAQLAGRARPRARCSIRSPSSPWVTPSGPSTKACPRRWSPISCWPRWSRAGSGCSPTPTGWTSRSSVGTASPTASTPFRPTASPESRPATQIIAEVMAILSSLAPETPT